MAEDGAVVRFEAVAPHQAELGESPVWSADGAVWWVDISGKAVLRTAADGATTVFAAPEEVGFVALSPHGPVAGLETGLFALDPASGRFTRLAPLAGEGVRFNDATVDATGRLWAGTMDRRNLHRDGTLLRIEPDLSMTVVHTGLGTPNGLAVDAARGRIYLSDTRAGVETVWIADVDLASGAVGDWHVFADVRPLPGRPDGATLDEDGRYLIAGVDAGVIHVFAPDGRREATLPTPSAAPTKIAFGGAPDRLYLTSKAGPGGGGLLAAATVPYRGSPAHLFGGAGDRG